MDSVTQLALGAAVGVAVMGRRQPAWKSALLGGIAGTLPDLDVFIEFGDPISNMVRHRAETHSFFWQTLAAPIIAGIFGLVSRRLDLFLRWWVMVWLALVTHAGLDGMTIYGTQLLLPRENTPFGVGSIFIIDPLYTVPLLIGLVATLRSRHEFAEAVRNRFARSSGDGGVAGTHKRRWNLLALLLSSGYLVWTWQAQQHVTALVMQTPAAAGLPVNQVLVTPTAFNSVLWRIVLRYPDRYEEGFYSLVDPWVEPDRQLRFTTFEHDERLDRLTRDFVAANSIRRFSKGFYNIEAVGQSIRITDLRMGQAPNYVFSFAFARREAGGAVATRPAAVGLRTGSLAVLRWLGWLGTRMMGRDVEPPR